MNSQPALSQVLVKELNGTKTFYVYGLIGEETNSQYRTYHFDYRGSTVALTDNSGQVTQRFQYAPYGKLVSGDATQTPFLFNGMYGVMTDDNGLYYMRARYYSPEIKRFVNQDVLLGNVAVGQTLNRYAFVTGRPVSLMDPFGLSGKGIEEPSLWENFIPIWGSGKAAAFYFRNGQWIWGTINTGLAITDVFLVKAILTAVTKGVCKGATKAGAGGNWPVIGETLDSSVVKQANSKMCGSACRKMLLNELGFDVLQEQIGKELTSPDSLSRTLSKLTGLNFKGGMVGTEAFEALNNRGSWIAMMKDIGYGGMPHWVVVDGIDNMGRVIIRDPWEGTKYLMEQSDFFKHWLEIAVFK